MTRWKLLEGKAGAFAVGLGAYILGLIATLPATFVDAGLQRASHDRLGIAEARGTLWTGGGLLEIRSADRRAGVALDTAWRLLPQSLLRGQLVWKIGLDAANRPFLVTISPSRIELMDATVNLPAMVLGLAAPRLAPLELKGDLQLRVASLSIGRGRRLTGNATLQWRAASSALTSIAPLGDYELRLTGENTAGHAELHTLKGPLQLDGKGSWASGSAPRFQATARVPAEHQLVLAPLLRLIAIERGAGNFELQLR